MVANAVKGVWCNTICKFAPLDKTKLTKYHFAWWKLLIHCSVDFQAKCNRFYLQNRWACFPSSVSFLAKSVCPDWAIFERFLSTNFHIKVAQKYIPMLTFWAIMTYVTYHLITALATFWATLDFLFQHLVTPQCDQCD